MTLKHKVGLCRNDDFCIVRISDHAFRYRKPSIRRSFFERSFAHMELKNCWLTPQSDVPTSCDLENGKWDFQGFLGGVANSVFSNATGNQQQTAKALSMDEKQGFES